MSVARLGSLATDQSPGSPQDALEPFLLALARPAGPTPDPEEPLAFAAGWHAGDAIEAAHDADAEHVAVLCVQLGADAARLQKRVEQPAWDAQLDRAIAYAISRPLPSALLADAPDGTLLAGLRAWRHDHARPRDQGVQGAPTEP